MTGRAEAGVHTDQCVCVDCRDEWDELVDWSGYRKCPVCRVDCGEPCRALSGRLAGGRPDGASTDLAVPHGTRPRRSRNGKSSRRPARARAGRQ